MELDKKTLAAIIAVVLFGGNLTGIINTVSPDIRNDPFTGREGQELDDRLTILELTAEQIMDDDRECKKRQAALEKDLKWLRELVTTYQSATKEVDRHQSKLIADCMRRTQ